MPNLSIDDQIRATWPREAISRAAKYAARTERRALTRAKAQLFARPTT
jgi:hypothetical protein